MQIFIMRHGEAESCFVQDARRNLTEHGREEADTTGQWLNGLLEKVDLVIVSPYNRALQTLDSVCSRLPAAEVMETDDVTPYGEPEQFHHYLGALLSSRSDVQSLLIISHMPFVSSLVDELCDHLYSLLFATAGVAHLDYDPSTNKASLIKQYIP